MKFFSLSSISKNLDYSCSSLITNIIFGMDIFFLVINNVLTHKRYLVNVRLNHISNCVPRIKIHK